MNKRLLCVFLSVLLLLSAFPIMSFAADAGTENQIYSLDGEVADLPILEVDKVINDFENLSTTGSATVGNYTVPTGVGSNTDNPNATDYSAKGENAQNVVTIQDGVLKDTLSATKEFNFSVSISPKSLTRGNTSATANSVALKFHVDFTGIVSKAAGTKVTFEPKIHLSKGRSGFYIAYCIPGETFYYIPDATEENPNPEMQILTTGGGVLVDHGNVWGYAGQSGTIIVPFDAWDNEAKVQFNGVATIWNLYSKNTQGYHNRSSVNFQTYNVKYAAGDVFAMDDVCWMKKPTVNYDLQKTVENFSDYTPSFAWKYNEGNHSAYSSPDGLVTKDSISVKDGRFAITPKETANKDTCFTLDIESGLWKSKYEAFSFDVDYSETDCDKTVRLKFYGYDDNGHTEFSVYNTTITLIADNGTVSYLTLDENSGPSSTWDIPDSFKGKIIIPKSGVHSSSANIDDTFNELVFSFETRGWEEGGTKSVYLDNMAYFYNSAQLDDAAGTDFTTLDSQQYETSALIKEPVHTAEAYFKTTDNHTQSIIATKFGSVGRHGYLVNVCVTALGQLKLTLGTATVSVTNVALNDGAWHHVAVVASDDNTSVSCYVDGALAKTVSIDSFSVPELAYYLPVTVGNFMPAESKFYKVFDGSIANVRLWKDARTAEEIAANAAISVGAEAEGLIAEWTLSSDNFKADTTGNYDLSEFFWNIDTENALFSQYNRDAAEGEFTVIFLPDTQTIIKNFGSQVPDIFDWVIANAERLNIKAVVSLGDIVEHGNATASMSVLESEMATLSAQYNRLTAAGIPWVATPGDHDYDYFGDRTSTMYDKYFTKEMLINTDEFELGGLYDGNSLLNSYYYMRPNDDIEYIIFSLEVQPRDEVIAWANSVIAANPDCRVILATHKYMNYAYCRRHTEVSYNHGNPGETVWQRLVSQHKNIDMILCGHNESTGIYTAYDTGVNGNKVLQVNCDLQNTDQSYKTVGATILARFNADGSEVSFNLYSAHHNLFIDSHSNDITFDLGSAADELDKPLADEYYGGSSFKVISSKDANSFPAEPGGYVSSATDTGAAVNPEYYAFKGGNISYEWDSTKEAAKITATADGTNSSVVYTVLKHRPNTTSNMMSFHIDATGVTSKAFSAVFAIDYSKSERPMNGGTKVYFKQDGSDVVETINVAQTSSDWNNFVSLKAGVSGTYYIPFTNFDDSTNTTWNSLFACASTSVVEDWRFNSTNYKYNRLRLDKIKINSGDVFYIDDVSFLTVASLLEKQTGVTSESYEGVFDNAEHGITVNAPEGATVKYATVRGDYTLDTCPTFKEVGTYTVYYLVTQQGFKDYKGTETVTIKGLPVEEEAKNLTLTDSIAVNYKLNADELEGFDSIRAEFSVGDKVTKVDSYTTDENGNIVFSFAGVNPKNVGDTITATYYRTKDGVEYPSAQNTYSVAQNCRNLIEKYANTNADYEEVVAVCKGLLNFAAASQEYFSHNTESLANAGYEQYTANREYTSVMAITANEGESTVAWRSAGLNFSDNVALRFNIETTDIEGLVVKAVVGNETWFIPSSAFSAVENAENRYYVYFNKLSVACMSDVVDFTVYKNGTQVSDTLTYSIESYAFAKANDADIDNHSAIEKLVRTMMNYGDAAIALKNKQ